MLRGRWGTDRRHRHHREQQCVEDEATQGPIPGASRPVSEFAPLRPGWRVEARSAPGGLAEAPSSRASPANGCPDDAAAPDRPKGVAQLKGKGVRSEDVSEYVPNASAEANPSNQHQERSYRSALGKGPRPLDVRTPPRSHEHILTLRLSLGSATSAMVATIADEASVGEVSTSDAVWALASITSCRRDHVH